MRFVAPTPTPKGLARRLPPAVFPPVMGLFGLGLAWRRAADVLGPGAGAAEALLGGVSLLFVFATAGYAVKLMRRPPVLVEELRLLPGRLGLSALMACLYLLAVAILPYFPTGARWLVWLGAALHAGVIALILRFFLTAPPETRRYSAAGHLYFVSPIVAALALSAIGFPAAAKALLIASLAVAAVVWTGGGRQLLTGKVAAPLRPLLALHLAPAAVAGLVAQSLDLNGLAQAAAFVTAAILALLLARLPRLLDGGFSPLWSAFTFPLAATVSLWLGQGGAWQVAGLLLLAAATLIVPWVAFRVLKLWAGGQLAVRTNAASA